MCYVLILYGPKCYILEANLHILKFMDLNLFPRAVRLCGFFLEEQCLDFNTVQCLKFKNLKSFHCSLQNPNNQLNEARPRMVGTNLKAETMSLMEKRAAVENEMDAIINRLSQPDGPGLSGNLVDAEAFYRI